MVNEILNYRPIRTDYPLIFLVLPRPELLSCENGLEKNLPLAAIFASSLKSEKILNEQQGAGGYPPAGLAGP
ncbi:hypothetical protein QMO56_19845 [Roseomonas sp. E05]|uniref:hypothetical protein n=1 Tax=Roseomonas sp. E05 TaxID=3046310 RepID=UPI0024BB3C2C|nr:hypothetical protein [Roseomonas sp. E05]MDJ0390370.1 hypothetical protein [Roseomonas sp. E05]